MKIYPILNNLGKGKYVFIFILNERAVGASPHTPLSRNGAEEPPICRKGMCHPL